MIDPRARPIRQRPEQTSEPLASDRLGFSVIPTGSTVLTEATRLGSALTERRQVGLSGSGPLKVSALQLEVATARAGLVSGLASTNPQTQTGLPGPTH